MVKSIALTWLSKTDLSNLNSGEGAGNLTELKVYDNGRKPYVSGQAVRRALFDTIQRSHPERFRCSPETPCGDVENCWSCDLRGFLAPEEKKGGTRRWSPVKASPALGQVAKEIVSDLLTRHSDITKENRESKDMRLAHVQMMDNIYKLNLVIDTENVGRVQEPTIVTEGKKQRVTGWHTTVQVSEEERILRLHALMDGVYHLSGFAKQARQLSSLAPECLILSLKQTYNQRGLSTMDLDAENRMDPEGLMLFLKEAKHLGDRICVGWAPGIVSNEKEIRKIFEQYQVPVLSVFEAIEWAKTEMGKERV
ncbi:type I-B CRISPR-associated protein Cas7/Cst2/DevR [Paenactinomyces guangxiensis]|uniref:Type I-B CRISPR-associated protein Cas7/Cst2/DevR n=1 Tax=Paenactinomyces guangxiensis TaxID=1490290 RepID=A0A7W1WNP2_9BACL|nr:type I-B CRISPR-associated protein Cas7/Cst2/DevR [Paenactinomyces guangxiensis]MBA4493251.1 type I-B CRISPR-associated protein Cas7/Cst2/DevR [Paenactinomyces guangxiensis]MBH8589898.1 type I-B CRISPR-associated protein Cas7/Cst2/DevR [Paenactinomyces guangxiensis]